MRSMNSASFSRLKAEKSWVWQTPQTLCRESGRLIYCGCCCVTASIMSRALNKLCHAGTSTCPSSMSCQCSQLIGHSCSNPVHIDHQHRTESKRAGVKQWQLQENHSLPNFHCRKGSDQWRVSPSQCWKLRNLEFGRHLRHCVGNREDWFIADAAVWQPRGWAEHWTTCAALEDKTLPISMCCQTCQLLGDSCSYLIHINQQYRKESTHAGVKQWQLQENHSLHSF